MDLTSNVFYKVHFQVSTEGDVFENIIRHIRHWVQTKYPKKISWNWDKFKEEGVFSSSDCLLLAKTLSFKTSEKNLYWACKIIENKSLPNLAPRTWTSEIGFEQTSADTAVFSFILYYSDKAGFIGDYDTVPKPSVPKLIKWIVSDEKIHCKLGETNLFIQPKKLDVGDMWDFWSFLNHPRRGVPVIFISPNNAIELGSKECLPSIDPFAMAENVIGNALVYYSTHVDSLEEMRQIFDSRYLCFSGSLRIYRPYLARNNPKDILNHRYVTKEQIQQLGESKLILILRRALSQDIKYYESREMFRIDDCVELRRKHNFEVRYNELRQSAESSISEAKFVSDLFNVTDDQISQFRLANEALVEEKENLGCQINSLEQQLSDQQNSNRFLEVENKRLNKESMLSNKRVKELEDSLANIRVINQYPETTLQIIEYFRKLFSDSIDFSMRGLQSVKDCVTNPDIVWDCLFSMATVLCRLYREHTSEIDKVYKMSTGWDLARGEGSKTRKDKELMALRKDEYDGRTINIEKHVKRGNDDKSPYSIRVYFDYDNTSSKIVIGSIGIHIENSTSQNVS